MCSSSGFILILIASFGLNWLDFGAVAVATAHSDSNRGVAVDDGAENSTDRRRIDITRKRIIHYNGVEIDENSLVEHLEQHERELIFGKSKTKRSVKLVHLSRHRPDASTATAAAVDDAANASTLGLQPHGGRRVKRADSASETRPAPRQEEVSLRIEDTDGSVELRLRPTPQLIDDAFVFIRRYANTTQFIEDSHKLAKQYERCFYSNDRSALDLCDDQNVRGVFHHNATDFIIHPLPARFGNATHVILESREGRDAALSERTPHSLLDEQIQFEPEEEDFNELDVLHYESSEAVEVDTLRPVRATHPNGSAEGEPLRQHHHHNPLLHYRPRYRQEDQHFKHQHNRKHNRKERHLHQHRLHHHKAQNGEEQPRSRRRRRRFIASAGDWKIPQVLHIETAIFVDSDLFKHMAKNFPVDTESQLIRFVLAMINGVQLLYHHPSLGRRVNFVLKRLEILYKDPKDLRRSSDIDTYLSNFCMWQKSLNPPSDTDAVHYDHALILTGLDLYVINKNGKLINQVVGLAPVAGMCTPTSSCTINEGKHFESVFVVAHEMGHNLGMRHDTNENSCDSSLYIMSPTLGSGKITWSKCSRTYLNTFLETPQARCLFDRGQFVNNLDHAAEGMLPGERFDANQQCMLKYGKDSVRARHQVIAHICRDLHCQRDRYTWTSHPALEGTECGERMWCRSGDCVARPSYVESLASSALKQSSSPVKPTYDKSSFVESSKMGHLLHEYNFSKLSTWSEWGVASACDSGCLYGPSNRLREGSTGLKTYMRTCLDHRRRCMGRDRKFESCIAKQCYSVPKTTIESFARHSCEKAQKFDAELTGEGLQRVADIEESCKVFCKTKTNGTKSRNWTFPDGTTCRSKFYSDDVTAYCIAGRCEQFSCDNATNNYYKIDAVFCQQRQPAANHSPTHNEVVDNRRAGSNLNYNYNNVVAPARYADRSGTYGSSGSAGGNNYRDNVARIYGPTTVRSKYENEVAVRSFHGVQHEQPYKRKTDSYQAWNKYNYRLREQQPSAPLAPMPRTVAPPRRVQPAPLPSPSPAGPVAASLVATAPESEWVVKSGCHSSCMAKSRGVQVVTSRRTGDNNIQLCGHTIRPCERLLTPSEYAENTCARYKLKVRGLSGRGSQIAASISEPDRSCRVGCQDEFIKYRYYLVNGKYGHFPLGTKCSHTEERYCINGKCLEFGADNIPLEQSHISLALFRSRRSLAGPDPKRSKVVPVAEAGRHREKRSYLYYEPVNITETITQEFINGIVNSIMDFEQRPVGDELAEGDHIEFTNPIHIATDELNTA